MPKRKEDIKKTNWKDLFEWLGHYLFDYSLARTLNSVLLVYLTVIFLKFFILGVNTKLITDYFQLVVCFGIVIILFSVVPVMLYGWGGFMNIFILFFGLLYIIDDKNETFFFPAVKLVSFFILLHIFWKIYIHYDYKQKSKKIKKS